MNNITFTLSTFRRHKMRTLFTVLSVAVAFAIFLVLATLYNGFAGLVNYGRAQRLDVWSDGFGRLPVSYAAKIAPLEGVKAVAYQIGIFGHFRDPKNDVFVAGVPFAQYLKVFPELSVTDAARQAMSADRGCAIAGAPLAKKMGWRVGDAIPISGGPPQKDGGTTWYFQLCGIFKSTLPDSLMGNLVAHYEYLNQGTAEAGARDQVDQITLMTDDARDVSRVAHTIERMFANAQPPAMALPDALLYLSVVKSFGDIGEIITYVGAAVFLSMLIVTGNAMSNSVRERLNEFAVMRALGFSRRRLVWQVLRESSCIVGVGAVLGLVLGWRLCVMMAPFVSNVLPYFVVNTLAVVAAVLLAGLFSVLAGILPAQRLTVLPVADTLRGDLTVQQAAALCFWNIRSLLSRLRNASVVVIGFFVVVLVFVAVLSVRDGILRSETRQGTDQLAIVTSSRGSLDASALDAVNQAPGVARINTRPETAPTDFSALLIRNWRPDMLGIAIILAIGASKVGVLPNFRVVEGRMMRPGFNEMIMGEGARRIYPEYLAGRTIQWQRRNWKIVGVYSTGSVTRDSEFLVDLHQFQDATKSGNKFSGIDVRLVSPTAFAGFKTYIEGLPNLGAAVKTMAEEDEDVGKQFRVILALADGVITILMAAGAIFATLNVMYGNVASRSGELAVLRALGFSRFPVLAAVLSEAVLLALAGGVVGVILAVLAFNGLEAKTLMGGWLVSFCLAVTPSAIVMAFMLTLGMGFIGGLFPAIRAARLPVARALRDG